LERFEGWGFTLEVGTGTIDLELLEICPVQMVPLVTSDWFRHCRLFLVGGSWQAISLSAELEGKSTGVELTAVHMVPPITSCITDWLRHSSMCLFIVMLSAAT